MAETTGDAAIGTVTGVTEVTETEGMTAIVAVMMTIMREAVAETVTDMIDLQDITGVGPEIKTLLQSLLQLPVRVILARVLDA